MRNLTGVVLAVVVTLSSTFMGLEQVRAHGGDPSLIHACVKNQVGEVKIIAPNGTCLPGWTPTDWSITGPQGPQGPAGADGARGPAGADGAPGTNTTILTGGTGDSSTWGGGVNCFMGPGNDGCAPDYLQISVPAGTVANLQVHTELQPNADQSTQQTYTITVFHQGVAGALTCTIGNNNTRCEDRTHTMSFADGDFLSVQVSSSGGAQATHGGWSLTHTAP